MNALAKTKEQCSQFIRESLPAIRKVAADMPTIPSFYVKPDEKRKGTFLFVDTEQTNWWQLSKGLKEPLYMTSCGRELAALFEETLPFSGVVNKRITITDLRTSSSYETGNDISNTMLTSYLFSAGCGKWSHSRFNKVWNDCLGYFDPSSKTFEYFLYAPIEKIFGVKRNVDLNDGLVIRRLPPNKVSRLASLDDNLSGRHVVHRFTQWASCFFEKRLESKKIIEKEDCQLHESMNDVYSWESVLNEEVALLRCLLSEEISASTFSFIRDGYPRYSGTGKMNSLPWRARSLFSDKHIEEKDVRLYRKRRSKFLGLHGKPGWENAVISMRRYAIAWENPFRADILADIVAALEQLVLADSKTEVGYKLRTRVAHFLGRSPTERQTIAKNISDAYTYRSNVVHGGYVFDNPRELPGAQRVKKAKGRGGNRFHDTNEVHRLIYTVSQYYRNILNFMIDRSELIIHWDEKAL